RVLATIGPKNPLRPRAAALLGDIHSARGRAREAAQAYSESLDSAPVDEQSAPRFLRWGDALATEGKLEKAIDVLGRLRGSKLAPEDLDSKIASLEKRLASGKNSTPSRRTGRVSDAMIGREIERYRVLELLGEGGFAWVYKAEHTLLRRAAAVKVLKASS